jgi:hypothetical protein
MTAVNWDNVTEQAINAAATSLGSSWSKVSASAAHSIQTLVQTAQYIANNSASLDATDQKLLTENQQLAMQSVLLGYEDIGIVAAEQAVAAAWAIVQTALTTALEAAIR